MKTIPWVVFLAVCLNCVLFQSSPALMKFADLDTVAKSASRIVRGTVVGMESYWGDDHRVIYTDVLVAVQSQFKGVPVGREVTVTVAGGIVGDIGLTVEDMPRFSNGQDVILFLNKRGEAFEVNFLHQGKYTVKDEVVVETQVSLQEFLEEIRSAVKKGDN